MLRQIKELAKKTIRIIVHRMGQTKPGKYFFENVINSVMGRVKEVSHNGTTFRFSVPNTLCNWRAQTFSTKEPETLDWIDSIPNGSILWDIGANIGLYSIYAAKQRMCAVWAFEPSVFNLELLARNVFLNNLSDKICIVPLALSDKLGVNALRMTTMAWGGALSTFGKDYGWNGENFQSVFEYKTLGLSMEDSIQKLNIQRPDYIKIDVDGIEHLILKGGSDILKLVKGVLIEVNDEFYEQANNCHTFLTAAGLEMFKKEHSTMIENSTCGFKNTYNQIWVRA